MVSMTSHGFQQALKMELIVVAVHLSIQAVCHELCSLLPVLFVLKSLFHPCVRYWGGKQTLIRKIHRSSHCYGTTLAQSRIFC